MPPAPKRMCLAPRCPEFAAAGGRCAQHQRPDRSAAAKDWHRMYDRRWQKYRLVFLMENPLCVDPLGDHGKRPVASTVVDHIQAHRGDYAKFWDPANHQSLCAPCHGRKTATEDGGFGR